MKSLRTNCFVRTADIDECTVDPDICTIENAECINTNGSYICTCKSGYEGSGTTQCTSKLFAAISKCDNWSYYPTSVYPIDIDECARSIDNCDDNAACTDTVGSYYCTCSNGYEGDGTTGNCTSKIHTVMHGCRVFRK